MTACWFWVKAIVDGFLSQNGLDVESMVITLGQMADGNLEGHQKKNMRLTPNEMAFENP